MALANALEALGIKRGEPELIALCKQNARNGTSWTNMVKAAKLLAEDGEDVPSPCPLMPRVIKESKGEVAAIRMANALQQGRPVICLVDDFQHYVAVVGTLGQDRVCVVDSGGNTLWHSYTWREWMERWEASDTPTAYYGLVI